MKYNVPIIYTKDSEDTAKFISVLAKKSENETSLNVSKKNLSKNERMQFILEGFPGIGPKTAQDLLNRFGTFKGVYDHLEDVSPSVVKKLKEGKEGGEISLKLAKILKDVPIEPDFEKMDDWQVDNQKVLDLFSEYGFRTLTNRVKDVGKSIAAENQMKLI